MDRDAQDGGCRARSEARVRATGRRRPGAPGRQCPSAQVRDLRVHFPIRRACCRRGGPGRASRGCLRLLRRPDPGLVGESAAARPRRKGILQLIRTTGGNRAVWRHRSHHAGGASGLRRRRRKFQISSRTGVVDEPRCGVGDIRRRAVPQDWRGRRAGRSRASSNRWDSIGRRSPLPARVFRGTRNASPSPRPSALQATVRSCCDEPTSAWTCRPGSNHNFKDITKRN